MEWNRLCGSIPTVTWSNLEKKKNITGIDFPISMDETNTVISYWNYCRSLPIDLTDTWYLNVRNLNVPYKFVFANEPSASLILVV